MSATVVLNNGNQAIINYDLGKIFVWNNRYDSGTSEENETYDDITHPAGTLLGRVSATGEIKPLASGASDGSQYPVGVLAQETVVPAGDTATMVYCVSGDVVESKVILDGSDEMDTVISGRTIKDRIGADTVGIKLVASTELAGTDNE